MAAKVDALKYHLRNGQSDHVFRLHGTDLHLVTRIVLSCSNADLTPNTFVPGTAGTPGTFKVESGHDLILITGVRADRTHRDGDGTISITLTGGDPVPPLQSYIT